MKHLKDNTCSGVIDWETQVMGTRLVLRRGPYTVKSPCLSLRNDMWLRKWSDTLRDAMQRIEEGKATDWITKIDENTFIASPF